MTKSFLSIVTAPMLVLGAGLAGAQTTTTTTTTWTPAEGTQIMQYSTTQHYQPYSDPGMTPTVGMVLPQTVTVYPLPPTVEVPSPNTYSYTIVNSEPVIVERTTRRVVHVWPGG